MQLYTMPVQIRWSDIDANRHLRHSVYYDYGAAVRMNFLNSHGLTTYKLEEFQIGPVLFREEAIFKREIILEDKIALDVELIKATADYSRWSLRHQFIKADGTIAAILNIDGAWIDMQKRKLAMPNEFIQNIWAQFRRPETFQFTSPEKKS